MDHYHKSIFWRQMRVPELIRYCSGNKELLKICQNPDTWRYLLERDFDIIYKSDNPQKKYYKQVLKRFSQDQFSSGRYYENEIIYDGLNKNSYDGLQYSYRIALSALGIDDYVSTLFGNKVGNTFVSFLQGEASNSNKSLVETLFDLADL